MSSDTSSGASVFLIVGVTMDCRLMLMMSLHRLQVGGGVRVRDGSGEARSKWGVKSAEHGLQSAE